MLEASDRVMPLVELAKSSSSSIEFTRTLAGLRDGNMRTGLELSDLVDLMGLGVEGSTSRGRRGL
jgi:hypothetical protein